MKTTGWFVVNLSISLSAVCCSVLCASELEKPINSLKAAFSRLEHAELMATYEVTESSDKLVLEKKANQPYVQQGISKRLVLRCDGDRTLISVITQSPEKGGGRKQSQYDWVSKNRELLAVRGRLDEKMNQLAPSPTNLGVTLASRALAGDHVSEDIQWVIDGLGAGAITIGYCGSYPLRSYLDSSASLNVRNDGEYVVLKSESFRGNLTLWLDKDAGFLPRKLRLVKEGAHLTSGGRRVDAVQMNGDENTFPSGGVKRIVSSADNIGIGVQDSLYYIQKIVLAEKVETAAGPVIITTVDASIDNVRFAPYFDSESFSPRLRIPKGTSVTIVGAEHLPYEWDGEKAVPTAAPSQVALRSAITSPEAQPRRISLWTLIGINLLVAVIAAGLVIFRKKMRKGGS